MKRCLFSFSFDRVINPPNLIELNKAKQSKQEASFIRINFNKEKNTRNKIQSLAFVVRFIAFIWFCIENDKKKQRNKVLDLSDIQWRGSDHDWFSVSKLLRCIFKRDATRFFSHLLFSLIALTCCFFSSLFLSIHCPIFNIIFNK